MLLEAGRRLRSDGEVKPFVLHIVTTSAIEAEEGVVVHRELKPNDDDLIKLYQQSHIFCLPTFADCLPMVLSEAGAMGLALVSTDVGAIREIVRQNETGVLVPRGDVDALTAALKQLINDSELRDRLGGAAARFVRQQYDARANANALAQLLISLTTVPSAT